MKYKNAKIVFYLSNNVNETNQNELKKVIFKLAFALKVIYLFKICCDKTNF